MQRVVNRVGEGAAGLWTIFWVFKRERAGKEMAGSSPTLYPITLRFLGQLTSDFPVAESSVISVWDSLELWCWLCGPSPVFLPLAYSLTVSLSLEWGCLNPVGECSLLLVLLQTPVPPPTPSYVDSQDASVPLLTPGPRCPDACSQQSRASHFCYVHTELRLSLSRWGFFCITGSGVPIYAVAQAPESSLSSPCPIPFLSSPFVGPANASFKIANEARSPALER